MFYTLENFLENKILCLGLVYQEMQHDRNDRLSGHKEQATTQP
jgi:hypothetical protein